MKVQVGQAPHLSIDDTFRRPCNDRWLRAVAASYLFDSHAAKTAAGRFVAMTARTMEFFFRCSGGFDRSQIERVKSVVKAIARGNAWRPVKGRVRAQGRTDR